MPGKNSQLLAIAIVLLGCFGQPNLVQADSVVFQEDFSSSFQQWETTRDEGHWWTIANGQAYVDLPLPNTVTELVPQDGVWQRGWKNLEYSLDYTPYQGTDRNLSFNVQNSDHWYEIHFVDTFLNLVKVKTTITPFNLDYPYVMNNGQTYHIVIRFNNGLVQVFVNQTLILEQFDWTFNASQDYGKIGIKVTTGKTYPTKIAFDNIQVKLIEADGERLHVPLIKQSDPQWASLEYDSAHEWSSDPTIKQWGCALASSVMILRYYHITTLPTGQDLNPATLNDWLKNQPDGYLKGSLLNWLAITRLSKIMSPILDTPSLEYSRFNQATVDQAKRILNQFEPVILETPGHFMVGTGLTGNHQDIWINDPDFSYQTLSQHQAELISVGRFHPSHTDLSYVLITTDPENNISLQDAQAQLLNNVQSFTEYLESSDTGERSPLQTLIQIPKPETQALTMQILPSEKAQLTQIFTYDNECQVELSNQEVLPQPVTQTLEIKYQKNASSLIENFLTFAPLQAKLVELWQSQNISDHWTFFQLYYLASLANSASIANQKRYLQLLESELNLLKLTLTEAAQTALTTQLATIQASLPP